MAIKSYKKGTAVQLSTNFKSTEFDCHGKECCSTTLIDEQLVKYLQQIRTHFNTSISVSSAYRCLTHNKNVDGATGSRHMKGQAADIYATNGKIKPAEIAKYAESIGILGIGLYETDADGYFVHIDTRTTKSFWYGQKQEKRTTFGGTVKEESPKEDKVVIDTSKVITANPNPKDIWDFLKKQGLNDFGVAGLMGNLYAESGLRPINLQNTYEKSLGLTDAEYTAAVDQKLYSNFANDKAGYGLAQWTYPTRKQNMLTFHSKKGTSIGDLTTQLEFLMHELNSSYKTSVLEVLKNAKSVLEASNAVLLKFERPANQSVTVQNKRAEYGKKYYDQYAEKIVVKDDNSLMLPSEGVNEKMKYSANNKPLACMQTQSTCYKGTSKMTVKGVLWHSTGANNPTLKRYVQPSDDDKNRHAWLDLLGTNVYGNDWNHITRQAGLNAWIGKLADGTIATIQTMPWDFKPWGCGSGAKGSCNNGWIQFEICEDGLTDKTYFDKVYHEACELTAYLCDMFNIDPNGTVEYNGVTVPTILCHYDSHKLGLGSNHGDIDHWFPKFGKSMKTVREDVAKLLPKKSVIEPVEPEKKKYYRVRKDWDDPRSQIGAYTEFDNATKACDKAGIGYEVYDDTGVAIYPKVVSDAPSVSYNFNKGDAVKLVPGATYSSGGTIPKWVFNMKLYVRDFRKSGEIIISTEKTGPITGVVMPNVLVPYSSSIPTTPHFAAFLVRVTADVLNVRSGPSTSNKITTQVYKNEIYTIVDQQGKWGKLKSGAGWIHLDYAKKV